MNFAQAYLYEPWFNGFQYTNGQLINGLISPIFQLEDQLKKDTSAEKEAALEELRSSLQSKFHQDIKQVEEDLNIAKQAAVTKTREEMNKEKTESLRQLQEDLESSYEILVKEVTNLSHIDSANMKWLLNIC